MALSPAALPEAALEFLRESHLATLTTLRPDGTPHVVPVGFTWDDESTLARVITGRSTRKARNVAAGSRAVLCQVQGWRWITLEGQARVIEDAASVAAAVERYTARYRPPRVNPQRVVVEVSVDRVLGLLSRPGA
jgi:PPOX class probable F420-dependent enzyme